MGFGDIFKKLLGSGNKPAGERLGEGVEYNGYIIRPAPRSQNGQFLTAGYIEKPVDGITPRKQYFVRADTHASWDSASEHAILKGQQIINEQGDNLFQD